MNNQEYRDILHIIALQALLDNEPLTIHQLHLLAVAKYNELNPSNPLDNALPVWYNTITNLKKET
jgi:hypothetical protein